MNLQSLRERARRLKIELIALALAARHPQTPWYAKLIVAGCVAYALTPVDLIPDAIPVIGFIGCLLLAFLLPVSSVLVGVAVVAIGAAAYGARARYSP